MRLWNQGSQSWSLVCFPPQSIFCLIFKILRGRETKEETEGSHFLVCSSNACTSWDWGNLSPTSVGGIMFHHHPCCLGRELDKGWESGIQARHSNTGQGYPSQPASYLVGQIFHLPFYKEKNHLTQISPVTVLNLTYLWGVFHCKWALLFSFLPRLDLEPTGP